MEKVPEQHLRNKITLTSFIFCLMVAQGHAINYATYGLTGNEPDLISRLTYYLEFLSYDLRPVVLVNFMFYSGFLFFRTFQWEKVGDKLKSRVKSILIPYILWATIYYLILTVLPNFPPFNSLITAQPGEVSLIGWFRGVFIDEYYTLWFLKLLILYIALCPVWYFGLRDYKGLPTGLILILVFVVLRILGFTDPLVNIEGYLLGAWIGINHKEWLLYKNKWLSIAGMAYLIFSLFIMRSSYSNALWDVLLIPALWYGADLFTPDFKLPEWMSMTFFFYVAHDLVLEVYEKIYLRVLGIRPIWALLDFLFMPLIAVMSLVLISKFMRRFTPHVWRALSGGR